MVRLEVDWNINVSKLSETCFTVAETEVPSSFTSILDKETLFWQTRNDHDGGTVTSTGTGTTTIPLPKAYHQGKVSFGPLTLNVTPSVMIPRHASYTLVECSYRLWMEHFGGLSKKNDTDKPVVVDLGTGSGCLLLALKQLLETNKGNLRGTYYGVDISSDALAVAKTNDVSGDCTWLQASFGDEEVSLPNPATLIVCNPPYHLTSSRTILDVSHREHEPPLALFVPENDDNDPCVAYKQAWATVQRIANPNGAVVCWEVCPYNGEAVYAYFQEQVEFTQLSMARDTKGCVRSLQGLFRKTTNTATI
jgi:release factor glutamine methyltransferase